MRLHRRHLLALLACPLIAEVKAAQGENNAYAFSFDRAEGGRVPLEAYRGKPILIVNTATRCGLAGQFAGLEQLWQRYRTRGLMLIAVPSNDFGGQEPLAGAAIAEAVRQSHGASYLITEKVAVRGEAAHPFYRWAASQRPAETPTWNFHKYLIGRDGSLAGSFSSRTDPVSSELVQAIGQALEKRR
ncbi:glutathione peroxidase [Bosea sp. NPDC055594]